MNTRNLYVTRTILLRKDKKLEIQIYWQCNALVDEYSHYHKVFSEEECDKYTSLIKSILKSKSIALLNIKHSTKSISDLAKLIIKKNDLNFKLVLRILR